MPTFRPTVLKASEVGLTNWHDATDLHNGTCEIMGVSYNAELRDRRTLVLYTTDPKTPVSVLLIEDDGPPEEFQHIGFALSVMIYDMIEAVNGFSETQGFPRIVSYEIGDQPDHLRIEFVDCIVWDTVEIPTAKRKKWVFNLADALPYMQATVGYAPDKPTALKIVDMDGDMREMLTYL